MLSKNRFSTVEDDEGAVLVTVVVVMLVGFVVASLIAASVMFTIQSNVSNTENTQAFIAAESGRDVAVASLKSAIVGDALNCGSVATADRVDSGAEPYYDYEIWTSDVTLDAATSPTPYPAPSKTTGAWAPGCPTATSKWVWIESEGWKAGSAQVTTTDSIYPWYHGPATQPAGTLAFFEGKFTATKTTYTGDLVIRTGNYTCNNGAGNAIDGDLWVLNGGLEVSSDCIVTGSVYTRGLIDVKNNMFQVGGDVISLEGSIYLTADDVKITGDVHAGAMINTKNGDGTVGGSFKAPGGMAGPHDPADWKHPTTGAPVPTPAGQVAPVITPTLDQVFDATSWIELTGTTAWSSPTEPVDVTNPYTGVCTPAQLKTVLQTVGTRAVIDMAGCGTGTINLDLKAVGGIQLARDVVITVPASAKMDLKIDGAITKPAGTDPQLFIVHLDANGSDGKPTCGTGADKLTTGTGVLVRTLVYSGCGISNTISLTMNGQFYMGNDGLHLNNDSVFTCKAMSWKPTLSGLSCGVKGAGGIYDPSKVLDRLDELKFQTE